MRHLLTFSASLCGLLTLLFLSGCATYKLRGRVVPGRTSSVAVVDQHDPRLDRPGLGDAAVRVTIDPQRLNRKQLSTQHTDSEGAFAVPVGELGAGTLEYQARITAQLKGYHAADDILPLPGSSKRVLITLTPGQDRHPPKTEDFLNQTMKMGEPYMRE